MVSPLNSPSIGMHTKAWYSAEGEGRQRDVGTDLSNELTEKVVLGSSRERQPVSGSVHCIASAPRTYLPNESVSACRMLFCDRISDTLLFVGNTSASLSLRAVAK